MTPNSKYDPEDIESLLLTKQFHELYPEERDFVLKHIESPEEYENLRATLFRLHDAANEGEWLEPEASIKKNLMREFTSETKGGFLVWLNSVFRLQPVPWYRQPAFAMAFGVVIISFITVGLLLRQENNATVVAENKIETTPDSVLPPKENQEEGVKSDSVESTRLFAENLSNKDFPPTPQVSRALVADVSVQEEIQMPVMNAAPETMKIAESSAESADVAIINESSIAVEEEKLAPSNPPIANKSQAKGVITEGSNIGGGSIRNQTKDMRALSEVFSKSKSIAELKDIVQILYTAH